MKTKQYFLCALIGSALLQGKAAQITNAAPITPLLRFSLLNGSGLNANQFKAGEMINDVLTIIGTNFFHCRHLPHDQSFEFRLFDMQGKEMPKTKAGRANSHSPSSPPSNVGELFRIKPHTISGSNIHRWFCPADLFVIDKPGTYELEMRYRLLVPMTNGMPDYTAITNAYKFAASQTFGIITSEPVRVKVIKE